MSKSGYINARIDGDLKAEVHQIFEAVGLNPTAAITLYYNQVKLHNGLPFEIKVPNKGTQKAFEETEQGIGLTTAGDVEDLFEQLND